jgi:hypothetical protein
MEPFDSGSIQLELKYCERCGGLGLRPQGSDLVFCAACTVAVSGFDTRPRSSYPLHSASVPRRSERTQTAFWSEGGHA